MANLNEYKEALTSIKENLRNVGFDFTDKEFNNLPIESMESIQSLQTRLNLLDIMQTIVLYTLLIIAILSVVRIIELAVFKKKSNKCFISFNKVILPFVAIIIFELVLYFTVSLFAGFAADDASMEVRTLINYARAVNGK